MLRAIFYLIIFFFFGSPAFAQQDFVKVKGHQFVIRDKPYKFLGVNMWYAGLLATNEEGKQRLVHELDFLKKQGVNNIRVLAMAEGMGIINGKYRVTPALRPTKDSIDNELLMAFDFFLNEISKRKMYAVIYLSNNWEWSGGFLQYLNWNEKLSDSDMRNYMEWDKMRDEISKFYSCDSCKQMYFDAASHFINRKNSISGISYHADPSIMAWEIANEPRPMRPAAIPAYKTFIHDAAYLIKSLDKQHLITTGSEGVIGSENAATFFEVHSDSLIDYATLHIWPKNWQWFSDTSINKAMVQVKENTIMYLKENDSIMRILNKPLVLEEFGMPRDAEQLSPGTPYHHREAYFRFICNAIFGKDKEFKTISCANFWAFGGHVQRNSLHSYWQPGDPLMGDPPFEPQGINAVYESDSQIWKLVRAVNLGEFKQ